MFHILILYLGIQTFTEEGCIRKQLVIEAGFNRLNKLVFHETIECMVILDGVGGLNLSTSSGRMRSIETWTFISIPIDFISKSRLVLVIVVARQHKVVDGSGVRHFK